MHHLQLGLGGRVVGGRRFSGHFSFHLLPTHAVVVGIVRAGGHQDRGGGSPRRLQRTRV